MLDSKIEINMLISWTSQKEKQVNIKNQIPTGLNLIQLKIMSKSKTKN